MAPLFPAILVGGPPHSGKSMLVYRLSQALRQRGVAHYALRASPDGEGGWSYESDPAIATALRRRAKTDWTPDLAVALHQAIAGRHLPLLVDAGGKLSAEIESLADVCTHAVLIAAQGGDLAPWRALIEGSGLVLVADLISDRYGVASIINATGVLYGVISGLTPELSPAGPCFAALASRIAQICAYSADELYRSHLALTDIELVLHIERAIYPLPPRDGNAWQPDDLLPLLASLPDGEPLAVYGAGPTWLYTALAAFSHPQRFEIFDARYGWISPPILTLGGDPRDAIISIAARTDRPDLTRVELALPRGYIEPEEAAGLTIPPIATGQGVVLDGRLPNWLWCGLVRAYADAAWVAIYRPRDNDAVIVHTNDLRQPIGGLIALALSHT
ncbi:hypothetical protein EKD04_025350 [Chloroflexales bacterium ZM16-3]|nr:hypothetical protein [Chloroflexales bacterium ZM16-3]